MRIAWLGCGKLGGAISEVIGRTHEVKTYDPDPKLLTCLSVEEAVDGAQLVFVAVQTPHGPEYEGITDMPEETAPFDLSYLKTAVSQVVAALDDTPTPIVVVSTVLPGDLRRHIFPLLNGQPLLYNPAFVAMGTVEQDFLSPEFVLIGHESEVEAVRLLTGFYETLHVRPVITMSIESAELTKVAYNTYISQKIVFANSLMEVCDKLLRGNVDDVLFALSHATDRIVSPKYMQAGMGDGGPCHPRDNIAMSHLAKELHLFVDPFSYVTRGREAHSRNLAYSVAYYSLQEDLPVFLLGRPYKLGTDIETGSAGLLLEYHLSEMKVDVEWDKTSDQGVYVTCLPQGLDELPAGSILIDPWGQEKPMAGVRLIRIGRHDL